MMVSLRNTTPSCSRMAFSLVLVLFLFVAFESTALAQLRRASTSEPVDLMDTRHFRLREYRRMFRTGTTPCPQELAGRWRGVNKGIVTLTGYRQFIKEITPCGEAFFGDNLKVHQVSEECLRCFGWQPKIGPEGLVERRGKFAVHPPDGKGFFGRGTILSYRDGGNRRRDPVRLIMDKIVKIDEDHLLGRATARFGAVQIPLAYFMLERIR